MLAGFPRGTTRVAGAALSALLAGCVGVRPEAPPAASAHRATAAPSATERVAFYSAAIAERPRLYPAHTQLGVALLDRARESHDPALLAKARTAEEASLAIQVSFEALFAMASIQNFSHRFEDALRWGIRAADAAVGGRDAPDPAVTAALVEAYLGSGRIDAAEQLLPRTPDSTNDFYTAVSLARVLAEKGETDRAAAALSHASALALRENAPDLAAWAETSAAGVLIDHGRAPEARVHLDRAGSLAVPTTFLRLHLAELALATGDASGALAILEGILASDADPAIEALAANASRAARNTDAADRHFRAAERGFTQAIEAGEVYTLGSLAKLYLDADRNLPRARELARENLRWKRDRAARETLVAIEESRAGEGFPSRPHSEKGPSPLSN